MSNTNIKGSHTRITNRLPVPTQEQRQELSRMLETLSITADMQRLLRGETLDLVVGAEVSAENADCFDIHLAAFLPAAERLHLAAVSLTAGGEDGDNLYFHIGQPTVRGDVEIRNLRIGRTYTLHIRPDSGYSPEYRPAAERAGSYQASSEASYSLMAAPDTLRAASREDNLPELPPVYESANGLLRATVERKASGTTLVAVETSERSLAGSLVRFAFVEETGRIVQSGEVTLEPVEGMEGMQDLWEGRWQGFLPGEQSCVFLFESLA